MKILLISDIHANIDALCAIEKTETWDEAWCCGDLVDFGPFPVDVIQWVQEHKVHCVLGNHDSHVLALSPNDCEYAYRTNQWQWAHQNREQLSSADLLYLHSLPRTLYLTADGIAYQMQHQYDKAYGIIENQAQFDAFWQGDLSLPQKRILFGHTHRQGIHILGSNSCWINPGSVSYRRPDDPDKRAHYMIINNGMIEFGRIQYDRSRLIDKTMYYLREGHMEKTNLQDAFFFFGTAPSTRSPLPEEII